MEKISLTSKNFQIRLFQRIEAHLHSQEIEEAQRKTRTLLNIDPDNIYARTIELWLCEIDYVYQCSHIAVTEKHTQKQQIVEALQHLCRMVVVIL